LLLIRGIFEVNGSLVHGCGLYQISRSEGDDNAFFVGYF
jgi:hypothetical protein